MFRPLFITLLLTFAALSSCTKSIPTPASVEGKFPAVEGRNLAGKDISLPMDLQGKPAVLLIGYEQKAQFDIDRWLLGLLDGKVNAQILEVPTIEGWAPRLARGFIDQGMKKGIPEEDWSMVVTVYEDAPKIIATIGRENPRNAQVVVLNHKGEITWFHNRGYSPRELLELRANIESLP